MEFDLFHNLATGFSAALSLKNLGFALLGCLLGECGIGIHQLLPQERLFQCPRRGEGGFGVGIIEQLE